MCFKLDKRYRGIVLGTSNKAAAPKPKVQAGGVTPSDGEPAQHQKQQQLVESSALKEQDEQAVTVASTG